MRRHKHARIQDWKEFWNLIHQWACLEIILPFIFPLQRAVMPTNHWIKSSCIVFSCSKRGQLLENNIPNLFVWYFGYVMLKLYSFYCLWFFSFQELIERCRNIPVVVNVTDCYSPFLFGDNQRQGTFGKCSLHLIILVWLQFFFSLYSAIIWGRENLFVVIKNIKKKR